MNIYLITYNIFLFSFPIFIINTKENFLIYGEVNAKSKR